MSWETIGKLFALNNNNFLYDIDTHNRLPRVKLTDGLSTEHLIRCCKFISVKTQLSWKIVLDLGSNFTSETFSSVISCR